MRHIRLISPSLLILLSVASTGAPAASPAATGAALAEQCSAHDWNTYMNCQLTLLDARADGNYCVPALENAARYQYEFIAFMQRDLAGMETAPAATAAAAYLDHAYPCPAPEQ